MNFEVTEVCPHCGRENTLTWNVEADGYQVHCPNCGEKMMLCDACRHSADGSPRTVCDWRETPDGGWCWRMAEHPEELRSAMEVLAEYCESHPCENCIFGKGVTYRYCLLRSYDPRLWTEFLRVLGREESK